MKKKTELKTIMKGVKVTKDMDKLFSMIAKEQGVSVPKFLRDAGLFIAEMSLENKELVDLLTAKDLIKAQKPFHLLFKEVKDTLINSITQSYEELSQRLDRQDKFIELFLYVYLYHTPEVTQSRKQSAKKSAQDRKKKILDAIDKDKIDQK